MAILGRSQPIAAIILRRATPAAAVAVTQASYQFYADGTETGSTALGTQDTAYTVDVSGGDVNVGIRIRLQETNGGTPASTDDWRLQWEKNASGTWTDVT